MLFQRIAVFLGGQGPECTYYPETGIPGFDHIVDITVAGRFIRIGILIAVLFFPGGDEFVAFFFAGDILKGFPFQDLNCTCRAHDSNFG